jgi:hypothetical protein
MGVFRSKNEPKRIKFNRKTENKTAKTEQKTAGSEQAAWRKWGDKRTALANLTLPPPPFLPQSGNLKTGSPKKNL